MKVRFAPSPTGRLHAGNARIAVLNWLMAKKAGGTFLLRLDDTDTERSTDEYAEAIQQDLTWLGLTWDEFAVQSHRMDRYDLAVEKLKADGRLYPCYETADELGLKRKIALQAGRPPIYDREALKLSAADRAKYEAEGRKAHWRFKLDHSVIEWEDLVRGPCHFEGQNLSDPVLIREDGRPLYTLTSCVDDLELEVTHVLRGEDHVSNTAVQVQLFEALGGQVPSFAHISLMVGADGQGLSKRLGSLSLGSLRDEEGIEPMALNSYLARLGTPDPIEVRQSPKELTELFDISRFGRATPRFDPVELGHLNAKVLHGADFATVQSRLPDGFDEELWDVVRPNLEKLADARSWFDICRGAVKPEILAEDAEFLALAAERLPPAPWHKGTWKELTTVLKDETGRKGKQLFLPLRKALTGQDHGPELADLLPLIGPAHAAARLQGKTA
ncbi:glutamate--tRNA ligase [Kiloniella laminariae]|uniref:Glutamate--tRNA ligase n=1 Tax=Kiloniella laminariae TaxID=454162 RepID=A0ABT4LHN9_9PROT|nr:glutamate--tRNA ligase [Kiloniella laminariae]MCZ4280627.1 glutamate--tRNA ligase [Kiloniella laminariae]